MTINVVDKYKPREFTALMMDKGVVLCDKEEGSFLVLRFSEDLERLKVLLDKITIVSDES